jgi:glycosyltransferase involved in cell wall biosynthesis
VTIDATSEAPIAAAEPATRLPSASIVVPAYNEAGVITRNLEVLYAHMQTLSDRYAWEIVVVDDGSTDDTPELIDEFAATHPGVRTLHHVINFHLGQALKYAFSTCETDYVVTLDADLSYSVDHIERLLDAIVSTRARIVIASPYMKGGQTTAVPFHRKLFSRWANRILSWTAKGRLTTLTGMVRAYDTLFLQGLNLKAMDTEVNVEILYKAQLLRAHIVEIPAHLDWTHQGERRSSIKLPRGLASSMFVAFLFRPFLFFVWPGIVLVGIATYMATWILIRVVQYYGDDGANLSESIRMAWSNAPYQFVIAGVCLVLAMQLFSLAIISAQSKRYFEELFHLQSSVFRQVGRRR